MGTPTTRRATVLVVDDDPMVRRTVAAMLDRLGFRVEAAADAAEAVKALGRTPVAVVGLDVQLPGLDGPAPLAALRQHRPDLRCCYISGHTGQYTPDALLGDGGGDWLLFKPFCHRDLGAVLAAAGFAPAA